jgi:uncharacterized membrane protein YedE/YeeE
MNFIEWLRQPWPWYVAGPLIGLTVPILLIIGNKSFGISSSLRHICAACFPAEISFFNYDWKKEKWNLFFVAGIMVGAMIATLVIQSPLQENLSPQLIGDLQPHNIHNFAGLMPVEIFNWNSLFTLRGIVMMVIGGFFVGFGTRYAGGCTSGHSITGLSTLQWPSLVATICFMAGGFFMANLILPYILNL